ncbi:hypothetical protein [Trueperella pyogenes]
MALVFEDWCVFGIAQRKRYGKKAGAPVHDDLHQRDFHAETPEYCAGNG